LISTGDEWLAAPARGPRQIWERQRAFLLAFPWLARLGVVVAERAGGGDGSGPVAAGGLSELAAGR